MMIRTAALAAVRIALLSCVLAAAPVHAAAPDRIVSTEVVGTAFRITLANGRVLQGTELTGATPWLADRLGPVACTEEHARSGRLGAALMFDRSR